MGGTSSQPVSNTYAIKIQSQGLKQGSPENLLNTYENSYQSFINSLLQKSSSGDIPLIADVENVFLEFHRYFQKHTNKRVLKKQIENFILSSFRFYVDYGFCIALALQILDEAKKLMKNITKEFSLGPVTSHLVLGESGALFQVTYQIGFGVIKNKVEYFDKDEEEEEEKTISNTYFGIYTGLSVLNIEDRQKQIEDILQEVKDFLDVRNFELKENLQRKYRLIHSKQTYDQYEDDKVEQIEGGQAPKQPSKLKKFGKKFLSIFDKINLAMQFVRPLVEDKKKKDDDDEQQEGSQITYKSYRAEQSPKSDLSPLWRVGMITIKTSQATYQFTGTLIDDYSILTSTKYFVQGSFKDGEQKAITIQFPYHQPLAIDHQLVQYNQKDENTYCFLFLTRPYSTSLTNYSQFVTQFIEDHSTFFTVQNSKIYMCGYNQKKVQYNQASKILTFDQTHFIQVFSKNKLSVGSPIYYFDPLYQRYNIIGISHSQDINIDKMDQKRDKDQKTDINTIASQFAQKSWFIELTSRKAQAQAKFKYESAKVKKRIAKAKGFILDQSVISQIVYGKMSHYSAINSIGVIERKSAFETSYELGVLAESNVLITLRKYVSDDTKIYTVYIKKTVQTEKDPLKFELSNLSQFNVYYIQKIENLADDHLSKLFLQTASRRTTDQTVIKSISHDQLSYLHPLSGFILSIDRTLSNTSNVMLKLTQHIQQNEILQNNKDINSNNNTWKEGLMFAREPESVEYFFGFYKEDKPKGVVYLRENSQTSLQSIPLQDNRKIISDNSKDPYEYLGVIMSKFTADSDIIRVGTFSFLKSAKKDKVFIITCAHNVVYSTGGKLIALQKPEDYQNIRVYPGKQQQTDWNFQAIKGKFEQGMEKVEKVYIHPEYISQLKKRLTRKSSSKLNQQNFYDIAVIEVNIQRRKAGFIIKDKPASFSNNQIRNIQIAGYPSSQSTYGSKFGILYAEAVNFHEPKNQSECFKIFSQDQDIIIKHKLSTLSGNSGSPIFYPLEKNNQYELVGIHIAGVKKADQAFNLGTFIHNPRVFDWLHGIPDLVDTFEKR